MEIKVAYLDTVNLQELTSLINTAYSVGEKGLFIDTDEKPFLRHLESEVLGLVESGKLLVALEQDRKLVGCIKAERTSDEFGSLGCLAVAESYQGQGKASLLFKAAEDHLKNSGCVNSRLELLTPTNWVSDHKVRLLNWYTKLGYELLVKDSYEMSTERLPEGTALLDRCVLKTDADFTTYQRKL